MGRLVCSITFVETRFSVGEFLVVDTLQIMCHQRVACLEGVDHVWVRPVDSGPTWEWRHMFWQAERRSQRTIRCTIYIFIYIYIEYVRFVIEIMMLSWSLSHTDSGNLPHDSSCAAIVPGEPLDPWWYMTMRRDDPKVGRVLGLRCLRCVHEHLKHHIRVIVVLNRIHLLGW